MSILRLMLHDVGDGLEQLERYFSIPQNNELCRLQRRVAGPNSDGGSSTVQADKEKFHVDLDVSHFAPDEISVKVTDHFVIVEGKHEEKEDDHGWVSRQFTRKYLIPEQCDIDQVSSKLSSDGILSVIVPRKQKSDPEAERVIEVEHTGKSAVCEDQKEEAT